MSLEKDFYEVTRDFPIQTNVVSGEHLEFERIEKKPKTDVWAIMSKYDHTHLGVIKWFPRWRQYCFFPEENCVWSDICLKELTEALVAIKKARKERK